jgi:hypothetical protein
MHVSRRSLKLVVISLLCATLAPHRGHAMTPTDACTLLTPSQIESVIGVAVSAGEPVTSNIRTSCKWLQAGVDPFKAKTVIVSIKSAQAFEMGKNLPPGRISSSPVSGIGDEAYMTSGSISYGATLSVRKNGAAYTVTVRGYPDVATIQSKDTALAKLVNF